MGSYTTVQYHITASFHLFGRTMSYLHSTITFFTIDEKTRTCDTNVSETSWNHETIHHFRFICRCINYMHACVSMEWCIVECAGRFVCVSAWCMALDGGVLVPISATADRMRNPIADSCSAHKNTLETCQKQIFHTRIGDYYRQPKMCMLRACLVKCVIVTIKLQDAHDKCVCTQ